MELKNGVLLHNGFYRIELTLGQGGFGITYLAYDLRLNRKIAIKEFFPKTLCCRENDSNNIRVFTQTQSVLVSELSRKFFKEASNLARFSHPNIVRVHDIFEENNTAYFVMDYIEGENLDVYVKQYGPLTVDTAVRYISQIASALDNIHAHRINHLDVKPANIIVRKSDNVPVLVDFGLAKHYDTSGNETSFTPTGVSNGFAPIEQYREGGIRTFSPAVDIYALGATFYCLLTGNKPLSAVELLDGELSFPESFPQLYRKVVHKAMMPLQKSRYQTIFEFMSDLNNIGDETKQIVGKTEQTKLFSSGDKKTVAENSRQNNNLVKNRNSKPDSSKKLQIVFLAVLTICVAIVVFFIVRDIAAGDNESEATQEGNAIFAEYPEAGRVRDSVERLENARREMAENARLDSIAKENAFKEQLPLNYGGSGYDSMGNEALFDVTLKADGTCVLEAHWQGDDSYLGTYIKNGESVTLYFTHHESWNEDLERNDVLPLSSYDSDMRTLCGQISEGLRSMWIEIPEYGRCYLTRK